jgi:hypothetical protein
LGCNPPDLASRVTKITGVSHWHPASLRVYLESFK